MPISMIDHYSIRTAKLGPTRDFYVEVMGLVDGDRPPFDFPGHWMYCGEKPIVHLIGKRKDSKGKTKLFANGGGAVDHIAFQATDLKAVQKHLKKKKVKYDERDVPGLNLHQIFLKDPNGVMIELTFRP